jgi:hypothetical protein
VGGIDARVGPLGRVGGVVEAGCGVEDGPSGGVGVGRLELSTRHAVGDDPSELGDEGVDMCLDNVARVCRELDVRGEELGVAERFAALGADEEVEPLLQALRGRGRPVCDLLQWVRDACEPALGDGVAQRRLASEVAVDAAVADAERAGLSREARCASTLGQDDATSLDRHVRVRR